MKKSRATILITGGCGFIGSHFIHFIFHKYSHIHIINIDALYYCANISNIPEYIRNSSRYTFVKGNIKSLDLMSHIFNSHTIHYIVHFAAQSHVQNSFEDSLQYTQDNIVGTHTLLECSRQFAKELQLFIHISTDEVYGESKLDSSSKKTEQSLLCPTNPYAATKAAAEMLVQSYHHSFNLPIIITRGNNVYGPKQYNEKVIPRFMHVADVAKAIDTILSSGTIGEIYNIGCDEFMEISILELAKFIIKKMKPRDSINSWITYIPDRPFNDQRYYISNQKLKELGWSQSISLHDGLLELIKQGI